ncbi:tumor necrosis factor receptor superfamily member 16-like [Elysia marginata]|uniref:Tumor necrosis factor receptor superfamily member 16-like n=1 Tax=Elysia marginata TaxID=1093978 RepID=A0AAV4GVX3_9GAST|nr:tumor necrosis factor receptor superfamily member 16-like [Elysia marginata]
MADNINSEAIFNYPLYFEATSGTSKDEEVVRKRRSKAVSEFSVVMFQVVSDGRQVASGRVQRVHCWGLLAGNGAQLGCSRKNNETLSQLTLLEGAKPEPLSQLTSVEGAKPEPLSQLTSVEGAKPEPLSQLTSVEGAKPEPLSQLTSVEGAKPEPLSRLT